MHSHVLIIMICVLIFIGGPGMYQVVKCGASGHNIRCRASMRATPIGMMVLGNQVTVVQEVREEVFFFI